MKPDQDTRIFALIALTFVALCIAGLLLRPSMPNVGMALVAASPLCLLIQSIGWAEAREQDDSRANWRW